MKFQFYLPIIRVQTGWISSRSEGEELQAKYKTKVYGWKRVEVSKSALI